MVTSRPHTVAAGDASAEMLPGARKLLAAATRHFAERGYHGTSVRDIAKDADMTVAGLYHHFRSKQELLKAIMLSTLHEELARTKRAVAEAGDHPADQLRALVIVWLRFHTERQAEALIGSSELRSLEPDARAAVVALRDEQEGLFRKVIKRGRALGTFDVDEPVEAARAIVTMGSAAGHWYTPRGRLTPQKLGERYAVLALKLVGAR
ncbi:MAG TPA: TetR/AcrR family transcriptional regulator [Jatrophihabitans sp.]|nr:TetR/AcrR family transcriptional regulator [Jatrophihabitans sp.]